MRLTTGTRILLFMILMTLGGVAWGNSPTSPPNADGPTPVTLSVYIVDISNIDEFNNTFEIELEFESSWQDPRVAFTSGEGDPDRRVFTGAVAEEKMRGMWVPYLGAVNVLGSPTLLKTVLTIASDGTIHQRARAGGILKTPFDFRRFPFDHQAFRLDIRPFTATDDIVTLTVNEEKTGFDHHFTLPEWKIKGVRTTVGNVTAPGMHKPYSQATFFIDVERESGFYMWKVLLPILTIVCMSWVVFWMTDEQLGRRASTSATAILTIIAYQFIVAGSLPRIPYLTIMDRIILWSFITTAGAMLLNIVVKLVGDHETASRIDRLARVAFPVVYFSMLVFLTRWNVG